MESLKIRMDKNSNLKSIVAIQEDPETKEKIITSHLSLDGKVLPNSINSFHQKHINAIALNVIPNDHLLDLKQEIDDEVEERGL
jgi:hypothetical protein